MKRQNLTDRGLRALKPAPDGSRYEVMDAVVPGFGVRVSAKGKLTFILFTRYPGKKHPARRELGRYGSLTLENARKKARAWIELIQKGIDPNATVQEPKQLGATATFAELVEDYSSKWVVGPDPGRPNMRQAKEVMRILRVEFVNDRATGGKIRKGLGPRPVGSIVRADIQKVVDDTLTRGATATAHSHLTAVKAMFNWAVDSGNYGLESSPCDRMKPKRVIGVKTKRTRFHSDDELTVIWTAAERLGYPYGPIVLLLILTGKRKEEMAGARWREFDFRNKWWTIPASRVKGGKAVDVVPLTDTAIAILKSLPTFGGERKGDYVFSTVFGHKPVNGFGKARARLEELVREELAQKAAELGDDWPAEMEPWTLHDFRRTIRTHLPRLGVPGAIAELIIGHKKPGIQAVYDIYEYLDEKREALERWESHLAGLGLTFDGHDWVYGRTPSLARMKAG